MIDRSVGSTLDGWPAGVATAADRERFARYAEALAFYQGEQWVGDARRGETRLTFNYARTLVRKVAAYVFPAPVLFSVPDQGDAATANRAERALAELVAELDLARLDVELCIDGAVLGDAAIKVTWDAAAKRPTVAPVDPATLVVTAAPDNPRRLLQVTQLYALSGAAIGELFLQPSQPDGVGSRKPAVGGGGLRGVGGSPRGMGGPGGINGLLPDRVYPVVETWTAARWRVAVAGQSVRDGANPYGWIPYVIAPNSPRPHAFWGESDLVDLFDVCRELNERLSVLSRVLELSGSPVTVLENVDGSEGISVGPGAKWELPEGAKAYLLDLLAGGGIELHVQYVDLLYRALRDVSETPRTAFGDAGRDLSGAALEVEIQPLVQKVHRKRQGWETLFRQRNWRLLDLLERFGGEDLGGLRRTTPIWPSVLPSDRESAVRQATQLVTAGIQARRTAVAALGGDDPEAELERVLAEARALVALDGQPAIAGTGRPPLLVRGDAG